MFSAGLLFKTFTVSKIVFTCFTVFQNVIYNSCQKLCRIQLYKSGSVRCQPQVCCCIAKMFKGKHLFLVSVETSLKSKQKLLMTCWTRLILFFFQQLYRKKPGMTMSCAKLPQNISKNRYRDISPCKYLQSLYVKFHLFNINLLKYSFF